MLGHRALRLQLGLFAKQKKSRFQAKKNHYISRYPASANPIKKERIKFADGFCECITFDDGRVVVVVGVVVRGGGVGGGLVVCVCCISAVVNLVK